MSTELSIPGFKKKCWSISSMQVRQCILYYVLLLEVKWLLAGHLFPVQLPRFTSFHAQGVSLYVFGPSHPPPFDLSEPIFTMIPFHLIVDFESFWDLSFWMCEPVGHFCISVKSGARIKSGIYSKLKGGYQDQQSWRSLLLKSRNHGKEKRNPPWQPVCLCCGKKKKNRKLFGEHSKVLLPKRGSYRGKKLSLQQVITKVSQKLSAIN